MNEINPFPDEALHSNQEMITEIKDKLEMLERHRIYLEELLVYYESRDEPTGSLSTDL